NRCASALATAVSQIQQVRSDVGNERFQPSATHDSPAMPRGSVFDGGRLQGRLAVLHVDLKADGLAVVLRDQLLLVLAQLGGELVVGHSVVRLAAPLAG